MLAHSYMNITIGPTAVATCKILDEQRIKIADKRTSETSKEESDHS